MHRRKRHQGNQQKSEQEKHSENDSLPKLKWTKEDKRKLLAGLKEYGCEDIDAISRMLPNKPPEAIKSKIYNYTVMSDYLYEDKLINDWMKCGLYRKGDSVVPEALLFIQLFESQPPPSECKGYNFRAIYDLLYRACQDEAYLPELSKKTVCMLRMLLSKMDKKLMPKFEKELWDYLGRVYNGRHVYKVYPGKTLSSL